MKIVVGTKNPAKLNAIKVAVKEVPYLKNENIEIVSLSVESGVSSMPKTLKETILWAKNRAYNCKKISEWDFFVWMEWWTTIIENKAYLFWVVYILNNTEEHFWISNMLEVPEFFRKKIYDEWLELWVVLGNTVNEKDASKKTGAFWYWTDNMLTRTTQFVVAFKSAIAPFYNKYYRM